MILPRFGLYLVSNPARNSWKFDEVRFFCAVSLEHSTAEILTDISHLFKHMYMECPTSFSMTTHCTITLCHDAVAVANTSTIR